MSKTIKRLVIAAATVAALAGTAFAAITIMHHQGMNHGDHSPIQHASMKMGETVKVGDIELKGAWTRQTPPNAKVGGGYVTITNTGETADRLIGGSAEFAGRVEVHEMSVTDGVMKMAELKNGLTIEPGQTVQLKPGSFHIMFMAMKETPKEGDTVSVTLTFAKAGDAVVKMPVAAIGAGAPKGMKMDHSGHGHSGHDHSNHGTTN